MFHVTRHSNQTRKPLLDRNQIFLLVNTEQGMEKETGKGRRRRKRKKKGGRKKGEWEKKRREGKSEQELLNNKVQEDKDGCGFFYFLLALSMLSENL